MKRLSALLFIFGFFFLFNFTSTVSAAEFKSGEVVDTSDSMVTNGSLFISGRRLTVRGTVNGDLFCAGQMVIIEADVLGDVICAGQTLTINGTVAGDARLAGQTIVINGVIENNLTSFGQTIDLPQAGIVSGEVFAAAQDFTVQGTIGKTLNGGFESAELDGKIGDDVQLTVNTLRIGSGSSVWGNLTYESANETVVPVTASISGTVRRTEPTAKELTARPLRPIASTGMHAFSWVGWSMRVLTYIVLGLLMAMIFPVFTKKILDLTEQYPGRSLLLGFVSFFVIPILLVLLVITLIGIPIAVIGLFLWLFFLFISRITFALFIGKKVLRQLKLKQVDSMVWVTVTGVLTTAILFKIPFLGWLLSCIAVMWGFGAMLQLIPFLAPKPAKK